MQQILWQLDCILDQLYVTNYLQTQQQSLVRKQGNKERSQQSHSGIQTWCGFRHGILNWDKNQKTKTQFCYQAALRVLHIMTAALIFRPIICFPCFLCHLFALPCNSCSMENCIYVLLCARQGKLQATVCAYMQCLFERRPLFVWKAFYFQFMFVLLDCASQTTI